MTRLLARRRARRLPCSGSPSPHRRLTRRVTARRRRPLRPGELSPRCSRRSTRPTRAGTSRPQLASHRARLAEAEKLAPDDYEVLWRLARLELLARGRSEPEEQGEEPAREDRLGLRRSGHRREPGSRRGVALRGGRGGELRPRDRDPEGAAPGDRGEVQGAALPRRAASTRTSRTARSRRRGVGSGSSCPGRSTLRSAR